MVPRGSNAPGGLLGSYRSVLGAPRPVSRTRYRTVPSWSGPRSYEKDALGSRRLFWSGQEGAGTAKLSLCSCIFGQYGPVARASPG